MCGRSIEQEPPLKDGPHTPICGQGDWLASSRGRLSHLQLECAHKNPDLKAVRLRHDHCTHSSTFDFLRGPDRSSSKRLQAQRRPVPIWYFSCAVSITCDDSYPPNWCLSKQPIPTSGFGMKETNFMSLAIAASEEPRNGTIESYASTDHR